MDTNAFFDTKYTTSLHNMLYNILARRKISAHVPAMRKYTSEVPVVGVIVELLKPLALNGQLTSKIKGSQ